MLNHIVLMGRLTRDPELRRTGTGIAVASFTLAVDRDYAPKDGGQRETDFIDIVAWRSTAEFVSKYFSKGRMAVVSGRLQIRPWEDKDGNKRRSAEVVADNVYFGDSKRDTESSGGYNAGNSYNAGSSYGSDEDIDEFRLTAYAGSLASAQATLEALLATVARGQVLRQGVRAVILGKPNVGKSSLLNALAGFQRVIVTELPGTTRDTVEETVLVGSVRLRLVDTAGIRDASDQVEALGVARSLEAAGGADLALLVCDGSRPLEPEDQEAMEAARLARHAVCLLNKQDLPCQVDRSCLPFETVLPVSAKDGTGLEALTPVLEALFGAGTFCDGSVLTNARQADAIRRAAEAMGRARDGLEDGFTPDAVLTDVEEAMEAMGELSGRTIREDITNRIFERFCVGK